MSATNRAVERGGALTRAPPISSQIIARAKQVLLWERALGGGGGAASKRAS